MHILKGRPFFNTRKFNIVLVLSVEINLVLANSADPDEMRHSIWIFTVCQSISFRVSGLQRGFKNEAKYVTISVFVNEPCNFVSTDSKENTSY